MEYLNIPLTHRYHLKEPYHNMERLLEAAKYKQYQYSLRRDRKVIGLLMSVSVVTKYCCFLCKFCELSWIWQRLTNQVKEILKESYSDLELMEVCRKVDK